MWKIDDISWGDRFSRSSIIGVVISVNRPQERVTFSWRAKETPDKEFITNTWSLESINYEGLGKLPPEGKIVPVELNNTQLCGLGEKCTIHNPKKVEPWIPSVDEWDLLPLPKK